MNKRLFKILFLSLSLLGVFGIGFLFYNYHEGGTDYYMKVNARPLDKQDAKDDKGQVQGTTYFYEMEGIDKNGDTKKIEFTVNKEQPLKMDAYIKVKMNPNKGPISWGEVKKSEIPRLASEQLN